MMSASKERTRTSSEYVYYALQLYFSGLSLRRTSQRLSQFIKRNHVSIWNWIQRYKPTKILQRRCKLCEFVIDETLIKVGSDYVWLWVAIEPTEKTILGIRLSIERNMLVLYIILTWSILFFLFLSLYLNYQLVMIQLLP